MLISSSTVKSRCKTRRTTQVRTIMNERWKDKCYSWYFIIVKWVIGAQWRNYRREVNGGTVSAGRQPPGLDFLSSKLLIHELSKLTIMNQPTGLFFRLHPVCILILFCRSTTPRNVNFYRNNLRLISCWKAHYGRWRCTVTPRVFFVINPTV